MHDGSDHPASSRASDEFDRAHPILTKYLFAVAAIVWPLIVYAGYLYVAAQELGVR